jgi:hypothetical protein
MTQMMMMMMMITQMMMMMLARLKFFEASACHVNAVQLSHL